MAYIAHNGGGACCVRFTDRLNKFDELSQRSATLSRNHDPIWNSDENTVRDKVKNLMRLQD